MKNQLLACAFVLIAFCATAQKNSVKLNPLSLAVSTFNLSYERSISDKMSVQLTGAYMGAKISDVKLSGVIVSPAVRFYLSDESPELKGWYASPLVRFDNLSYAAKVVTSTTSAEADVDYSTIGGGVDFGRQWVSDSGLTLDLFLGVRYASGNVKVKATGLTEDDLDTVDFDGVLPRGGFKIGWAF